METALFTSTFRYPTNPTSFSSLGFSWFRRLKPRTSSNCLSIKCSSDAPDFHQAGNGNHSPSSIFRGLLRSLGNIKGRAFLQAQHRGSDFDDKYLQGSSVGVALLSVTSNAKVKISPLVATLAANPTFMSGLFAWFVAQSIKVVLNFFVEKKWDFRILFASGGMPSSHSALCTALTTSVALCHGVSDSLFPVCLGFSLIVMYDAIGVRRHAGMQAEVLNVIVEDLFEGHPLRQRKLKELLGHTPSQVFAGAVLGILVACVCCRGCFVAT